MTWGSLLAIAIVLITIMLLSGIWIPFAIGIVGLVIIYLTGGMADLNALGLTVWGGVDSFILTALPLFIFMAEVLIRSGVADRFYEGLSHMTRRLPGGLLQSNVAGCAMLAAISGSSVATAAAIGSVAIPQLKERNYDIRMATGSVAAGGTLGILIPPSAALILYGTFTEISIVHLFMAGLIPGLLLALIFMVYIAGHALIQPSRVPHNNLEAMRGQVLASFMKLVPFLLLIFMVLGSMYAGLATPTEAAAIGTTGAVILSVIFGTFSIKTFWQSALASISTSCTILLIVAMAFIFSYAISNAQIGSSLAAKLVEMHLDKVQFLIAIYIMYTILGMLMDSISMIMITVPLLYPSIVGLSINPIWFGVILVLQIELGQITPPFGLNLFVIQSVAQCKIEDVIKGCIPYYIIFIFFIIALTVYPEVALWLPKHVIAY